jgi:hypothetical protein
MSVATIILLSDLKDLRKQKEQELKYYSERLEELNKKLFFIRKEIELTNFIIDLIERENLVDLRKLIDDSNNSITD